MQCGIIKLIHSSYRVTESERKILTKFIRLVASLHWNFFFPFVMTVLHIKFQNYSSGKYSHLIYIYELSRI
jgi:hypothetical protein